MNSSLFLLFLFASAANIISPGAAVVMTVSTTIESGFRSSFPCRLGLALGIAAIMGLSASGLGLLVSTHPAVYTALRLLGVCYLVYLGVRAWRAPAMSLVAAGGAASSAQKGRLFLEAFWLQLSNPQAIIFSVSILPQFIDGALPYAPQASIMTAVYALMVFLVMTAYGWAAGKCSVACIFRRAKISFASSCIELIQISCIFEAFSQSKRRLLHVDFYCRVKNS